MTDEPIVPIAYVVVQTFTNCLHCGQVARHSEVMARHLIRPRNSLAAPVKHQTRVDRLEYNIPVEHQCGKTQFVPLCGACPDYDLSHLPPPPSAANLHDLAEPALALRGLRPAAPTRKRPTLEELA